MILFMSTGGISQLVSSGELNRHMKPRNMSTEYQKYSARNSQEVVILREYDITNVEFLEITFANIYYTLNDVKKIILTMNMGDSFIQQFPLGLLMNLNEPIMSEGKMYINLCFDMLFGNLKIVGFVPDYVRFKLSQNEIVDVYGITITGIYVDMQERNNLANTIGEHLIQQISFVNINVDTNDETQTSDTFNIIYLPFKQLSKGFFIQCENVDHINNILFRLNEHDRFDLNRFLIMTKCKKINQHLLYFPFNWEQSYSERTFQSFQGSVNFSRIVSTSLTITFDVATNNVQIYSLSGNIFRQMNGMGGIAHDIHLCNDTYDLRNNPLKSPADTTTMKPIVNIDRATCPISCEQIGIGDKYMCCCTCNNNFREDPLKQWLKSKRVCPLCRDAWKNFEIYTNG